MQLPCWFQTRRLPRLLLQLQPVRLPCLPRHPSLCHSRILHRPSPKLWVNRCPRFLAAFQSHSSPSLPSLVSRSTTSASPLAGNSASVTASTTSSAPYLPFPSATGNISVPSFISTYCTLGNSSLPAASITGTPSLSGARGAPNGAVFHTRVRNWLFVSFHLGAVTKQAVHCWSRVLPHTREAGE